MNRIVRAVLAACLVLGSAVAVSTASAGGRHAALAYNADTGSYGWARDQPSEEEAVRKALRDCGPGCSVKLAWHNGCGAFAMGQRNINWGSALGRTKEEAQSRALDACTSGGGNNCSIRVWDCN